MSDRYKTNAGMSDVLLFWGINRSGNHLRFREAVRVAANVIHSPKVVNNFDRDWSIARSRVDFES